MNPKHRSGPPMTLQVCSPTVFDKLNQIKAVRSMSSNLLRKELLSMALPYRSLGIAASVLLLVVALPAKAERAMSCPHSASPSGEQSMTTATRLHVRNSIKPPVVLAR